MMQNGRITIPGGSQAPTSSRHVKHLFWQVWAAQLRQGAPPGRVVPETDITFDFRDHPMKAQVLPWLFW